VHKSGVRALDDVSLYIESNEFVAIVGESGSGKSTLTLSVIGLLPETSNVEGKIIYKMEDVLQLNKKDWNHIRGTEIGMIFQQPSSSLNPIERIGDQIAEAIEIGKKRGKGRERDQSDDLVGSASQSKGKLKDRLRREAENWLSRVRIPDPEKVYDRYPFQLSGGMCQRVMIAMALAQNPSLLLADEPTTALDVTTQAQIIQLMKGLIDVSGTAIILVTHDLGVAAQVADRVLVMFGGQIVEEGSAEQIFKNPLHPYTQGLLKCYPRDAKTKVRLDTFDHGVNIDSSFKGCKFANRCPKVRPECIQEKPRYIEAEANHNVRCTLYY
jgi:oligopeptide/dipeptide ABC transporter ATP-binding protein